MPLPTGDTIGILADNLQIRRSVLPISKHNATRWAKGLGLPKGGDTIIYTGLMYQLIPFIATLNKAQAKLEDSPLADFVKLGRFVNKFVNISALMGFPKAEMKVYFDQILRNIALLLKQAGLEFGYLYEDELYSGALLYDLGVEEVLREHLHRVAAIFEAYKIKNVITVDPHTTNMLRSVYPKYLSNFALNVQSYLEVLAESDLEPLNLLGEAVAIHDSCLYARSENVLEAPRTLLAKVGVAVQEPREAGKYTLCCGGPAESLYPKKASAGASKRIEQLKEVAGTAVTMCPICLINLAKEAGGTDLSIEDIASYLVRGYCRVE